MQITYLSMLESAVLFEHSPGYFGVDSAQLFPKANDLKSDLLAGLYFIDIKLNLNLIYFLLKKRFSMLKNVFFSFLFVHATLFPTIITQKSLISFMSDIDNEAYKSNEIIVLFDIDNTIAHPITEVGSDQWLEFMAHRVSMNGIPITQAYDQLLPLYYTIQQKIDLCLVESFIPELITNLKNKGIIVLGLTTRHDPIIDRTLEQLAPLGVSFSSMRDQEISIPATVKPAIYKKGIIFCSSNNKGDVLIEFLKMFDLKPKKIFFVDDKMSNLLKVEKAALSNGIDCICIHYTGCQERINNFNPAQAEKELLDLGLQN